VTRALMGSSALLFVLCAYQWHGLRTMKAEIERLRSSQRAVTKSVVLSELNPDSHDEVERALTWLDEYFRAPEGLGRPNGLCRAGTLDAGDVTGWLFDTYLRLRTEGDSEGMAREKVLEQLRASEEWHTAHAGT
jgi:hypothetical protein